MKTSDTFALGENASDLTFELAWLFQLLKQRTGSGEIEDEGANCSFDKIACLKLEGSEYADIVNKYSFSPEERLVLILSLSPYLNPGIFLFFSGKPGSSRLALVKSSDSELLLPSYETALFLIAGDDMEKRLECLKLFDDNHIFKKQNFLSTGQTPRMTSPYCTTLMASQEFAHKIMRGKILLPQYSNDFPAQRITTDMDWDDLVLNPSTRRQVEEVKIWLRQRERLMNELGMAKRMNPGNKILFYGSPGTGKTLTAKLLGKYIHKDVFRIDLSMVISKYIGETEKNLAKVFDKAENSDWILFFDEADALFGSRTKVSSSNDRHANQEISYLLQRIEDFNGVVILASNMKSNIDDAFMRRFNNVVNFPFPKAEERRQLWEKTFPEKIRFSDDVNWKNVSDKYEFSGANITNIVAWCSLMAIEKGDFNVTETMLREGMAREMSKEGRTL
ncbi:MAG TPA: ATP-binding protein [Bacteroidia bacterium]|nr:ATP-binding protein [Bacteroidia bacterium]